VIGWWKEQVIMPVIARKTATPVANPTWPLVLSVLENTAVIVASFLNPPPHNTIALAELSSNPQFFFEKTAKPKRILLLLFFAGLWLFGIWFRFLNQKF
jgi:hypothetical protein